MFFRIAVALLGLTITAPARGDRPLAAAPLRAVIRLDAVADNTFADRVSAHLSDLPVELVVAADTLEADVDAQVAGAKRLLRANNGSVVIWLDERASPAADGHAYLHVYVTRPEPRLVRRRVEASAPPGENPARAPRLERDLRPEKDNTPEALSRATMFEISAIIVRSTLQEVLATADIAEPAKPKVRAEPAIAEAPVLVPLSTQVRFGWQPTALSTDVVVPGIFLELTMGSGRWSYGVTGAGSWPRRLRDDLAEVELSRLSGALLLRGVLVRTSHVDLEAGAQIGVATFRRSTVVGAQGTVATAPHATWVPLLGPEVLLRIHSLGFPWLGFVAGLGADATPGRPTIAYDLAGEARPIWRLWAMQPRAQLSLEIGLKWD